MWKGTKIYVLSVTLRSLTRSHQFQIEQFIETIFPQQKPGHVKTSTGKLLSPEEVAKQKQENKDSMWDMLFLMLAVLGTLALVSGVMVRHSTTLDSLRNADSC